MMRHAAITPDFRRSQPVVARGKVLNMFKNYESYPQRSYDHTFDRKVPVTDFLTCHLP